MSFERETWREGGLRAPFPWYGGKTRAAALIWERLGDAEGYWP